MVMVMVMIQTFVIFFVVVLLTTCHMCVHRYWGFHGVAIMLSRFQRAITMLPMIVKTNMIATGCPTWAFLLGNRPYCGRCGSQWTLDKLPLRLELKRPWFEILMFNFQQPLNNLLRFKQRRLWQSVQNICKCLTQFLLFIWIIFALFLLKWLKYRRRITLRSTCLD